MVCASVIAVIYLCLTLRVSTIIQKFVCEIFKFFSGYVGHGTSNRCWILSDLVLGSGNWVIVYTLCYSLGCAKTELVSTGIKLRVWYWTEISLRCRCRRMVQSYSPACVNEGTLVPHRKMWLNLCFLRPTRVKNANSKSIGSAIFARLTAVSLRMPGHVLSSNNCPFAWRIWATI